MDYELFAKQLVAQFKETNDVSNYSNDDLSSFVCYYVEQLSKGVIMDGALSAAASIVMDEMEKRACTAEKK